eukprot:316853-Chlamydomonas_euryale.AAC.2
MNATDGQMSQTVPPSFPVPPTLHPLLTSCLRIHPSSLEEPQTHSDRRGSTPTGAFFTTNQRVSPPTGARFDGAGSKHSAAESIAGTQAGSAIDTPGCATAAATGVAAAAAAAAGGGVADADAHMRLVRPSAGGRAGGVCSSSIGSMPPPLRVRPIAAPPLRREKVRGGEQFKGAGRGVASPAAGHAVHEGAALAGCCCKPQAPTYAFQPRPSSQPSRHPPPALHHANTLARVARTSPPSPSAGCASPALYPPSLPDSPLPPSYKHASSRAPRRHRRPLAARHATWPGGRHGRDFASRLAP